MRGASLFLGLPLCEPAQADAFAPTSSLRFLVEGVFDLRDTLRKHGSDLLIRFGKMEDVTAQLAADLIQNGDEVKEVFLQKEVRRLPCFSLASCTPY